MATTSRPWLVFGSTKKGVRYYVRARLKGIDGRFGDWSSWAWKTAGDSNPPSAVTAGDVEVVSSDSHSVLYRVSSSYSRPSDFSHFRWYAFERDIADPVTEWSDSYFDSKEYHEGESYLFAPQYEETTVWDIFCIPVDIAFNRPTSGVQPVVTGARVEEPARPQTAAKVGPSASGPFSPATASWYNWEQMWVKLEATGGSGELSTTYAIKNPGDSDFGQWQDYSGPFQISHEGKTKLRFYSYDPNYPDFTESPHEIAIFWDYHEPSVDVSGATAAGRIGAVEIDIASSPNDSGSGVKSIHVYRNTVLDASTAEYVASLPPDETEFVDTGIFNEDEAGTTYHYWIQAEDNAGNRSDLVYLGSASPENLPSGSVEGYLRITSPYNDTGAESAWVVRYGVRVPLDAVTVRVGTLAGITQITGVQYSSDGSAWADVANPKMKGDAITFPVSVQDGEVVTIVFDTVGDKEYWRVTFDAVVGNQIDDVSFHSVLAADLFVGGSMRLETGLEIWSGAFSGGQRAGAGTALEAIGLRVYDDTPEEVVRAGNLDGFLDYTSAAYGFAAGTSSAYFAYDPVQGVRVKGNITAVSGELQDLDITGTLDVTAGQITAGQVTLSSAGMTATGDDVSIELSDATDHLWLSTTDPWLAIGGTSRSGAPFRVSKSGHATMTDADVTGNITAQSGELHDLSVLGTLTIGSGGSIVAGNATLDTSGLTVTGDDATIELGTTDKLWLNATDGLALGGTDKSTAPFRVSMSGSMVAEDATITGEINSETGSIGGWDIAASTLSSGGSNIVLDAGNKAISVNSGAFGSHGIQLQYNAGSPRFYVGDGANKFFKFDGSNIAWKGVNTELTADGQFSASNATIAGDITAESGELQTLSITGTLTVQTGGQISAGQVSITDAGLTATGDDVSIDLSDATDHLWLSTTDPWLAVGGSTRSSAPFRVTKSGHATMTDADVTGTITAQSGELHNLSILGTLTVQTGGQIVAGDLTIDYGGFTATGSSASIELGSTDKLWLNATDGIALGGTSQATAPFRVDMAGNLTAESATITGEINSDSGQIGGWSIGATTISAGGSNVVLDSSGKRITVNDATFGNQGIQIDYNSGSPRFYAGDGADRYFKFDGANISWKGSNTELTASGLFTASNVDISGRITSGEGEIGGFTIGSTTLSAGGSAVTLDSSAKAISINNATFGAAGVQLQYNAGTPRFYAGNGSDRYFQFDGANVTWKGLNTELTSAGKFIASDVDITGKITSGEGQIGGWSIESDRFSATNILLVSGAANVARVEAGTGSTAGGVNAAAAADDIVFWAGGAHADRATANFRVTAGGSLTAVDGELGGWAIGTTTLSAGSNNVLLDAGNKAISVGSSTFGAQGVQAQYNAGSPRFYAGDGSTHYFKFDGANISWKGANTELTADGAFTASNATITGSVTASEGQIGGFSITSTTLESSASEIVLDSSAKAVSINSETFGAQGIQLQYNGGSPRAYIGNGTDRYFKFDGSNISFKGVNTELTASGTFTASNANITGTITASEGSIGGFDITDHDLSSASDEIVLDSSVKAVWINSSTFGSQGIQAEYNGGTPRFYAGNGSDRYFKFDGAQIAWKAANTELTSDGSFTASNATITGTIHAGSGDIGGFSIGSTTISATNLTLDSANSKVVAGDITMDGAGDKITVGTDGILIDGANKRIESSDFQSGVRGFRVETDTAEFNNIVARGMIRTAVFQKDTVNATNATFVVTDSTVLDADIDASQTTVTVKEAVFQNNDVIRLKDGSKDEKMQVTAGGGTTTLTVTRGYDGTTATSWQKGTALVKWMDRVLFTADMANGPYVDVITGDGTDASDQVRVRIGNLDGISGASGYGIWTDNGYFTGEVNATSGQLHDLTVSGTLDIGTGGALKSGATGYDSGVGWWFDYNGGTPRAFIGNADGQKITWGGSTLSVTGNIIIQSGSGIANLSDAGALATKDQANLDSDVVDGTSYVRTTPNEKTGAARAYTGLDASGNLVTKVLPGSNIATPSGAGLYLGADYLGYYSGDAWTAFIDNSGHFTFKANANNYVMWDGAQFEVKGRIVITDGSGISNLSDAGALATADDLDDVADGSTYKRTTADEKTGAGRAYSALDSSNALVTRVLPGANAAPAASGLYLGADYMGYYDAGASAWRAYVANDGKWYFGNSDGSKYVQWDGNQLSIAGEGSGITNIDGGHIQTNTITAAQIAANTITADEIAANTITANEIASNTITASEIASETITSAEIAAGSINADRLNVSQLSAITADMGSLTAGSIVVGDASNKLWLNDGGDGGLHIGGTVKADAPFSVANDGSATMTKATVQTSTGSKRIEIASSDNELKFYEGGDVVVRVGSTVDDDNLHPGLKIDGGMFTAYGSGADGPARVYAKTTIPSGATQLGHSIQSYAYDNSSLSGDMNAVYAFARSEASSNSNPIAGQFRAHSYGNGTAYGVQCYAWESGGNAYSLHASGAKARLPDYSEGKTYFGDDWAVGANDDAYPPGTGAALEFYYAGSRKGYLTSGGRFTSTVIAPTVDLRFPTSQPSSPEIASSYWDNSNKRLYIYDGSTWRYIQAT